MEVAEKGLKGGTPLLADQHLDAREGDSVDGAQGNLLQVPQGQPVDPHTALAGQHLEAEDQQTAAFLQVGLQGQMVARQLWQLQLEVGVLPSPDQQPADIVLQLRRDLGKSDLALCGVVQAHLQDCQGPLHSSWEEYDKDTLL